MTEWNFDMDAAPEKVDLLVWIGEPVIATLTRNVHGRDWWDDGGDKRILPSAWATITAPLPPPPGDPK